MLLPEPIPATTGFAPAFDERTRILILGSFPGDASLKATQYYAHPRNQFWPLMACILQEDVMPLPYPARLARLLAHRIGLWDVLYGCSRRGSLDSAIRHGVINDLTDLRRCCVSLQTLAFNGKAAAHFGSRLDCNGLRTVTLPSSSPAHAAVSFEEKLVVWRKLLTQAR